MSWRYIAQRATTGEWLDWEVPLNREELSWALSGAGALRGTVDPDVGSLRASDGSLLLDEWGTLLYAEADGELRWGGVLVSSKFSGSAWGIEAAGFATYPHGIPYDDVWASTTNVDPLDAVRELWRHVQAHPDGNLGVQVDATTSPVRMGTTDSPYTLAWWEAKDCGQEVDTLAQATPFDYAEVHSWSTTQADTVDHRLALGYPRLGTRRFDLALEQGVNVSDVVTAERNGDAFANEGIGIGAGEGKATVRTSVPYRDGRLRRPYVYSDKSVTRSETLTALTRREVEARRNVLEVQEVTVTDHPHAPLGSWSLGDDVLIRAEVPWVGDVEVWSRIVGWTLLSDSTAKLALYRSDAFTYGRSPQ